jgi:hypothetical protein
LALKTAKVRSRHGKGAVIQESGDLLDALPGIAPEFGGAVAEDVKVEVHRPLDWAKEWGGYSLDQVRRGAGEFSLFITNAPSGLRKSWNDGKKQRVEDCLGAFVSSFMVTPVTRPCGERWSLASPPWTLGDIVVTADVGLAAMALG